MSAINDGGNAFPIPGLQHYESFNGMTLRDYFAAKALQGMLADPDVNGSCKQVAVIAYRYADAMIKVREGIE